MTGARVLHINSTLDFGGAETHLRLIATTPGKRYEHRFCAIMRGGPEAETIVAAGGAVEILGLDPWRHPLRCVTGLLAIIRDQRPAIIHCHGTEGNLFGLMAGLLARVPVRLAEEIGISAQSGKARLAMKAIFKTATRVIGVSDAVCEWLVAGRTVPAHKVVRLYNPVALSDLRACPRSAGDLLRISFLGRLEPIKNAMALVDAMALLRDVRCELILIGEGSQRGAIERRIGEAGLEDAVRLCGFHSAPDTLLAGTHVYVQPSLSEGFGIALAEAMSCGLPAIVGKNGGMTEIVEDGRTGWLLDAPDAESIAARVREAASLDPGALAAMGNEARRSIRERFSPERYIAELEDLYDRCLVERLATMPRTASIGQTPTKRGNSPGA